MADINSSGNSDPGRLTGLTVVGSRLYFQATDGSTGNELWAHDTTTDETWQLADIWGGSSNGNPSYITPMGNQIYFQANDGGHGHELWVYGIIEHSISYS